MQKLFSNVGESTYRALGPSAVDVRGNEQPPYPCAMPLPTFELQAAGAKAGAGNSVLLESGDFALTREAIATVEATLDRTLEAALDLFRDSPLALQTLPSAQAEAAKHSHQGGAPEPLYTWKPVASFRDPNEKVNEKLIVKDNVNDLAPCLPVGGRSVPVKKIDFARLNEMKFDGLPHIQGYHPSRLRMTYVGATPEQVIAGAHSGEYEKRKEFTPSMKSYTKWLTNPLLSDCASPAALEALAPTDDPDELQAHRLRLLADAAAKVQENSGTAEMLSSLRHWHVESNFYGAPPPVSCREALMLVEKRYSREEDCFYVYGTSVNPSTHPALFSRAHAEMVKSFEKCVRVTFMFCWKLQPIYDGEDLYDNEHPAERQGQRPTCAAHRGRGAASCTTGPRRVIGTRAMMVSVMNPNGWTPTFILSWFKSEVGKELALLRRALYTTVRRQALARHAEMEQRRRSFDRCRLAVKAPSLVTGYAEELSVCPSSPGLSNTGSANAYAGFNPNSLRHISDAAAAAAAVLRASVDAAQDGAVVVRGRSVAALTAPSEDADTVDEDDFAYDDASIAGDVDGLNCTISGTPLLEDERVAQSACEDEAPLFFL